MVPGNERTPVNATTESHSQYEHETQALARFSGRKVSKKSADIRVCRLRRTRKRADNFPCTGLEWIFPRTFSRIVTQSGTPAEEHGS